MSAQPPSDDASHQHHHKSHHAPPIPKLETPDYDDEDFGLAYDRSPVESSQDHEHDDEARRSYDERALRPVQPLTLHRNRSTPSISTPPADPSYDDRSGYDTDSDLRLGQLSINDARHLRSNSNHSMHGRHTHPPPPNVTTRRTPWHSMRSDSIHSTASGRSSGYGGDSQGHPAGSHEYETDVSNVQSGDGRRPPPGPGPGPHPHRGPPPSKYGAGPPGQYPPPHGYAATTPGWQPPPQQQYPQSYNPLYAAASDVLGVGPPPGHDPYPGPSQAPLQHSTSTPYLQGPGPRGPPPPQNGGGLSPYGPVSQASLHRGPSAMSTMRPNLQRAPTTMSNLSHLNTRKSKAIDVTNPPYTKEYVDDYRIRIKADPDPEAHFAFAKYLIEAAKKIGHDSPDQKAVRKYRDSLIVESLKVIRRLATQGETFPDAQFFLANCHGTGMLGLTVDHERAYHLYLQAAKQNHAPACYRVAVCNDIGAGTKKDPGRAFTFYRKAASLGDTAAMYKLGSILLRGGLGQVPNAREAVQWLKRAAEQADEENPHALSMLATLHEREDNEGNVVFDLAYAVELYTKAAQLGHVPSQLKLGSAFETGALGCPVDPRRSIAWYTKAAEKGDPEAELCVSGWYLTGSEGILKQSDSEAYLWARRSANKGWPRAEYAVGYYAEVGIGVQQDMDLAKRWYMRAAAQGNKRAMSRLTELKRLGNKKSNIARPTRQQANAEGCTIM
ncbi:hypothetical protein FRB98_005662 [Tulasnella sp. 332]|nr:hypothetical protein FRB98_005662 [Tulasnella sp. 332]